MDHPPEKTYPCRRVVPAVILLLCLAGIAMNAGAASTRMLPATTTTSAFQVQQPIELATIAPQITTCPAGCACMDPSRAAVAWGADGYTTCSETPCGYTTSASGATVTQYCLKQKTATQAVIAVRPQATITSIQTAGIPAVAVTTKAPVHVVTLSPGGFCPGDQDCDGRPDTGDNCPAVPNTQQLDSDSYTLFSTCKGVVCKMPGVQDLQNCQELQGAAKNNCLESAWKKANPGGCDVEHDCQKSTDGYGDPCDNCREVQNPDQNDADQDCVSFRNNPGFWDGTKWLQDPQCGDTCDACPNFDNTIDSDNDGVSDGCDICLSVPNPDQKDTDNDCAGLKQDTSIWDPAKKIWLQDPRCGDACDNCKSVFNPDQKDTNGDTTGDACDCSDMVWGPYEQATDCGGAAADAVLSRLNVPAASGLAPFVKDQVKNGGTGCLAQSCSPCGTFNGNFSWTNWRGRNWMTPPTNQGLCGSCWVHSPIAVVEGMYNIHSGQAIGGNPWDFLGDTVPKNDLNNQNNQLAYWIVTNNAGGDKCSGGFNYQAMHWISDNGVPDRLNVHHYRIAGYNYVQTDCCGGLGEDAAHAGDHMIQYLMCRGPLSVCSPNWNGGGHCFTLVGYDQSKFGGTGGWLIKNSWGDDWPDGPYNPRRADWQFEKIGGLGGYAYIPVQAGLYGSDYWTGTWNERFQIYTSYIYEG